MDHTSQRVRVRFAPSPTGHLHIGSLRTALFNFLFARHHGGDFLVRIEDTDIVRSRAEYTDAIIDGLSWVDILSDEPIVMQTSRIDEHKRLIAKLLDEGKAYKCYCPTRPMASESEYYKYDGACRSGKQVVPDGTPYVVRIKLPLD